MSRILLAWELGLNLGHLTRLLPVAQRLRDEGHTVLVAARDVQSAATVLGPAGIAFVQAPHLPKGIALGRRASGYADILLSQGWADRSALWALTQSWLSLFRLFGPDGLVLDYSPTVTLAARIAKLPCVLVGNGFELPPARDPLPPFLGFSWATPEKAAQAERLAVGNANEVLRVFGGSSLTALRDLVTDHRRLFATFPELDHYGPRTDAQYIGPLWGSLSALQVRWPEGDGPRVFACLRPDTSNLRMILGALAGCAARVVCVASGFSKERLAPFRKDHIVYALAPVDLSPLLDADLCVSYGAEGTMMRFLQAGVPQLISPWHVETFMAARRMEASGVGLALEGELTVPLVQEVIERASTDTALCARAKAFSATAVPFNAEHSATTVVEVLRCRSGSERPAAVAQPSQVYEATAA